MGNVSPSNEPALEVTAMTLDRALFAAFHETRVPEGSRRYPRLEHPAEDGWNRVA